MIEDSIYSNIPSLQVSVSLDLIVIEVPEDIVCYIGGLCRFVIIRLGKYLPFKDLILEFSSISL